MSEFQAVAPSNIALIKYWGRDNEDLKWPSNDSLSMTLSKAETTSRAVVTQNADHSLVLNGQEKDRQQDNKVFTFLDFLVKEVTGDPQSPKRLQIITRNSFPTGCGLASSASGFAALTLAVVAALLGEDKAQAMLDDAAGRLQLAQWARIGSGSATRSLHGGYVHWQRGETPNDQKVTPAFDAQHWQLHDTVVLFSDKEKAVSSSTAHKLAATSPLFKARLAGLHRRLELMMTALSNRDLKTLGPLIEEECLEMHSIMMSSTPPVFYFDHQVGDFLAWLRSYRLQSGLEAYFTMDAGPNVHILCEAEHLEHLHKALQERLPGVSLFVDKVGQGPRFEFGGQLA
jgi:diphosphomevalonate decarboxylase